MHKTGTPKCRLCGEEDEELIRPCRCTGDQAYVHYNCLSNQIETARIMKVANVDGIYNSRCTMCKFHIQFKI
jgi:E3 ubiquitin-protein ligase DOA10